MSLECERLVDQGLNLFGRRWYGLHTVSPTEPLEAASDLIVSTLCTNVGASVYALSQMRRRDLRHFKCNPSPHQSCDHE